MGKLKGCAGLALFVAGLILAAGAGFGNVWSYNESPMLSKLVNAGQLPPVDERLPSAPAVLTPEDKTGNYGGNWRRAYTGLSDLVGARRLLYDPLVRWSPEYKIIPNLAHKWEVDEEGRIFTFHLIKGVRWSDGRPFTADDILFCMEDVFYNKELTPTVPKWLCPEETPPKVTKVDDHTIRFEFDKPYGLFLSLIHI